MSWITIIVGDLNEARVAELVEALRTEALGDGQDDPMPGIITKVVDEVRSCIGFCATTILDIDPTKIPANLKDLVVQKICRTMKGRLLHPLSDDEKVEESVYQKRLLQLTECAWPVDTTTTPIVAPSVQNAEGVELASSTCRRATRDSMKGI